MASKIQPNTGNLKPCPFCGSSDILTKTGKTVMAECQGCGVVMFNYRDGVARDVVAKWNRRTEAKNG